MESSGPAQQQHGFPPFAEPPGVGGRRRGALDRIATRTAIRACLVAGVLLLVAGWRIDQAVRKAYATGWRAAPGSSDRLPAGWASIYIAVSLLAVLALLLGAELFRRRLEAQQPVAAAQSDVRWVLLACAVLAFGLALAAAALRGLAQAGGGRMWLTWASVSDLAAVAVVALFAVTVTNATEPLAAAAGTQTRHFLQRQRINLVAVALFAVVLTVIAQTSGQAIDSIRAFTDASAQGAARLTFGLASALLLSHVVFEGGLSLARWTPTAASATVPWWKWLAAAVATAAFGGILLATLPVGPGIFICAGILALLGLLELPRLDGAAPAPRPPSNDRAPEYLAMVPLLAIAATTIAAAVDASLSDGTSFHSLKILLPGFGLAAVCVLMAPERVVSNEPAARSVGRLLARFGGAVGGVLALTGILIGAGSGWLVVATGCILCVLALVYTLLVFRLPTGTKLFLSAPVAIAAGFALFFAVNLLDVQQVTTTLGVFALVNVALGFVLAWLNFAVRVGLSYRPPRLLWWFRLRQLPILTLVLVAWVATGAFKAPETLHDVRVVDRPVVETAAGPALPVAPNLRAVFAAWVKAQPQLAGRRRPGPPVPLVLVASHGGGVRGMYWTALALDCLVAVSPGHIPGIREGDRSTCRDQRRSAAGQHAAERRILLASGVSGGAAGLYAYARELVAEGALRDDWVRSTLTRDLASPTVGWGLFHDIVNHIVGFHSRRGGQCEADVHGQCLTQDRASVLEDSFERPWRGEGGPLPYLRHTWDLRFSADQGLRRRAQTVPLLITNATVTGGKTRAIVSAAELAAWPALETGVEKHNRPAHGVDPEPLAGTVEVRDVLCATFDLRLSTAALLGGRFPFLSPSGHLFGRCARSAGSEMGRNAVRACARLLESRCDVRVVDGGYVDNSGLFTIAALWPSLRRLVTTFNADSPRKIAVVLVEIDNHYRATPRSVPPASGKGGETFVPLSTAFGGRHAIETYARSAAYRLTEAGCTMTIFPAEHPGLTAPLGWELSADARKDLEEALVRPQPGTENTRRGAEPVRRLRTLQAWIGGGSFPGLKPLADCVPS